MEPAQSLQRFTTNTSDSIEDRGKPHLSRNICLGLLCLSVAGEVVQGAVLHQSSKGEDEADGDKKVHGSDVGDLWQRLSGNRAERCHGQNCCDACKTSRKPS